MSTKNQHKKQKTTSDQGPITLRNNNDNVDQRTTVLHMSSNVTEIFPKNSKSTIFYNQ